MPRTIAIVFGQSHIGALTNAVEKRRLADRLRGPEPGVPSLHMAFFEAWAFDGDPPFVTKDAGGADVFNPAFVAAARTAGADDPAPTYCTFFGGNAHFVLALMRHPRPFDFVLPEAPDLPLDPTAECLPLSYVQAILQGQMDRYLYQLFQLRHAVSGTILAFAPPPPIAEDAVVMDRLDAFFVNNFARRELSPPPLRLKMWMLQRRLLKRICDQQAVTLVDPPAEGLTAEGFLAPACYGPDATHGGPFYGELVLRQIEARLAVPLASFSTFS